MWPAPCPEQLRILGALSRSRARPLICMPRRAAHCQHGTACQHQRLITSRYSPHSLSTCGYLPVPAGNSDPAGSSAASGRGASVAGGVHSCRPQAAANTLSRRNHRNDSSDAPRSKAAAQRSHVFPKIYRGGRIDTSFAAVADFADGCLIVGKYR